MLENSTVGLNDAKSVAPNSKTEIVVDVVHEKGFVEVSAIRKNPPLHQSARGHQRLYFSKHLSLSAGAR
jgi:hypothetical protein